MPGRSPGVEGAYPLSPWATAIALCDCAYPSSLSGLKHTRGTLNSRRDTAACPQHIPASSTEGTQGGWPAWTLAVFKQDLSDYLQMVKL